MFRISLEMNGLLDSAFTFGDLDLIGARRRNNREVPVLVGLGLHLILGLIIQADESNLIIASTAAGVQLKDSGQSSGQR